MTGGSDELVAAIVQKNVDDAAATSNSIIDFHKRQSRELAEALVALSGAVDESQVVDRKLIRIQESYVVLHGLVTAERVLDEDE
jgi:hypothetical protein